MQPFVRLSTVLQQAGVVRIKIAVYGKGGIGKSTISANLSAALAENGHRVLQIGCDPKHDSTRLLLGGRIPMTVLQYTREVPPQKRQAEDILYRGYRNVACAEAGGPEPGVGCAGRGIITTFELLEGLGIRPSCFDITLYDVLGDVVCGGFAVPIRNEYADVIYIVTSGEYLSLYAANNILRGIRNFTETGNRVAGIIYNARGGPEEDGRVMRFAESVNLPVIVHIPRSGVFASAEQDGCTLIERYPDSAEAGIFRQLAGHVERIRQGDTTLMHPALPLDDEDLELIVLLRRDRRPANKFDLAPACNEKTAVKYISKPARDRRPLMGCAFAGAVAVTARITDAAIVMHCPRSCVLSTQERLIGAEHFASLRAGRPYNHEMENRFVITDLTDDDFIYGGERKLAGALESVIDKGYKTIFIVTSCPPGITGDDVGRIITGASVKSPGVRIIPVRVDGNLAGDHVQGMMEAYNAATALLDGTPQSSERSVNIIGETRGAAEDMAISGLLKRLRISVNTIFLDRSNTTSLSKFNNACLNLPARRDDTTESLVKMVRSVSDLPVLDLPLPTGFYGTSEWLKSVAEVFGAEDEARRIIEQEKIVYDDRINRLRPRLEGRKVLVSSYPQDLDWIYDIASDLGMEIIRFGHTYSPFAGSFVSRYEGRLPIVRDYTVTMRSDDIITMNPDLVLFTFPSLTRSDNVKCAPIPYSAGFGFFAALDHAENWIRTMSHSNTEGWKNDGVLVQ